MTDQLLEIMKTIGPVQRFGDVDTASMPGSEKLFSGEIEYKDTSAKFTHRARVALDGLKVGKHLLKVIGGGGGFAASGDNAVMGNGKNARTDTEANGARVHRDLEIQKSIKSQDQSQSKKKRSRSRGRDRRHRSRSRSRSGGSSRRRRRSRSRSRSRSRRRKSKKLENGSQDRSKSRKNNDSSLVSEADLSKSSSSRKKNSSNKDRSDNRDSVSPKKGQKDREKDKDKSAKKKDKERRSRGRSRSRSRSRRQRRRKRRSRSGDNRESQGKLSSSRQSTKQSTNKWDVGAPADGRPQQSPVLPAAANWEARNSQNRQQQLAQPAMQSHGLPPPQGCAGITMGRGRGRGAHMTQPAWMTAGAPRAPAPALVAMPAAALQHLAPALAAVAAAHPPVASSDLAAEAVGTVSAALTSVASPVEDAEGEWSTICIMHMLTQELAQDDGERSEVLLAVLEECEDIGEAIVQYSIHPPAIYVVFAKRNDGEKALEELSGRTFDERVLDISWADPKVYAQAAVVRFEPPPMPEGDDALVTISADASVAPGGADGTVQT